MHVLIAPDSFKETLSAREAAEAMARGVRAGFAALPAEVRRTLGELVIDLCPIADGGEGTIDALATAPGAVIRTVDHVPGPLGRLRTARWLMLPTDGASGQGVGSGCTGVIEIAEAAGFHLVPRTERNPRHTTTFGVGVLMLAAVREAGCGTVVVTLGGSATCDGGIGMAQALGARFTLTADAEAGAAAAPLREAPAVVVQRPLTGDDLAHLNALDPAPARTRLAGVQVIAATDVLNPLYGHDGAAHVFAPQKGASPDEVAQLDAGLRRLAALLPEVDPTVPGSGAAGGLGFGLRAFAGATIRPGIDIVLDAVGFDARAAAADLIITGEGSLDRQSLRGKAAVGVARRAARHGIPTMAVAGRVESEAEASLASLFPAGVWATVDAAGSADEAMRRPAEWLTRATATAIRKFPGRPACAGGGR